MIYSKLPLAIFGALLLGLLGDILLRGGSLGIGLTIWIAVLALTASRVRSATAPWNGWLTVAIGFAVLFAIRDSDFLRFWSVISIMGSLALATLSAANFGSVSARLRDFATATLHAGSNVAIGAPSVIAREVPWSTVSRDRRWRRLGAPAMGVILAAPAVLIFGSLFASADPVFERVARKLLSWDLSNLPSHVVLTGVGAWVALGYLRAHMQVLQSLPGEWPIAGRFAFSTVGTPVAAVTMLFAFFVAIQAGYLFGGAELVQNVSGYGYADHARRGFFELVAACTLVVPMVTGGRWLLNDEDPRALRRFRTLSLVLLVLVDLVALSALWRMRLYTAAYGLTEDRFYAAVLIIWVGLVLAWLGHTFLHDRSRPFAFGVVVSGLALLGFLNLVNPDAVIARHNLGRATSGKALDASYLTTLSADAVPEIAANWKALDHETQCALAETVAAWRTRDLDWRSWTVSRARAIGRAKRISEVAGCTENRGG